VCKRAATGQLNISGKSQVTLGNVAIGPAGTGYMSVSGSGAIVRLGNVSVGSSSLGSGALVVGGGVMN